jgi:hypothetical protein
VFGLQRLSCAKMSKFISAVFLIYLFIGHLHGKAFTKHELAKELTQNLQATSESVNVAQNSSDFGSKNSYKNSFEIFNIACDGVVKLAEDSIISCSSLTDKNIGDDDVICGTENIGALNNVGPCKNITDLHMCDGNEKSNENCDEIIASFDESDFYEAASLSTVDKSKTPFDDSQIEISSRRDIKQNDSEDMQKLHIIHNMIMRDPKVNVKYIFLFV